MGILGILGVLGMGQCLLFYFQLYCDTGVPSRFDMHYALTSVPFYALDELLEFFLFFIIDLFD